MHDVAFVAFEWSGWILGGLLGAYLSHTVLWKGLLMVLLARMVAGAIGWTLAIENPIFNTLIFLAAATLLGGKWGLKLSGRQMNHVIIFSVVASIALKMTYIYAIRG